ncbi:MAG: cobalamin biosynthesis protein CbiD [Verrucomicrobia bacterium]|nr:cobalamin biosynthesis protein CbiD [Verrucomicrobiota bacterium]
MATLRTGYTTGACAAAAAKAATTFLCGAPPTETVEIVLADGSRAIFPVLFVRSLGNGCEAAVRKDAGDDPDVTDKASIVALAEFMEGDDIVFAAGEGVGTVTKPGLSVPPGEPAINPAPRRMIRDAIREVTQRGVKVTISIPGGRELATRTFNPRLGIVGGLSVLGTTGRVRPFSASALQDSLKCALDVAAACGVRHPVLVPGNIGERAARKNFRLTPEQVVQVSNQWGFMLDQTARHDFPAMLVLGHPGKLAKLMAGQWDTHSSHSTSAVPIVAQLAGTICQKPLLETPTVEGLFDGLPHEERHTLADAVSEKIRGAILQRLGEKMGLAVALINMSGEILGSDGDLTLWR